MSSMAVAGGGTAAVPLPLSGATDLFISYCISSDT